MIYVATFFVIVGLLLREIWHDVNLVYYLIKIIYYLQFQQAVKKAESPSAKRAKRVIAAMRAMLEREISSMREKLFSRTLFSV